MNLTWLGWAWACVRRMYVWNRSDVAAATCVFQFSSNTKSHYFRVEFNYNKACEKSFNVFSRKYEMPSGTNKQARKTCSHAAHTARVHRGYIRQHAMRKRASLHFDIWTYKPTSAPSVSMWASARVKWCADCGEDPLHCLNGGRVVDEAKRTFTIHKNNNKANERFLVLIF